MTQSMYTVYYLQHSPHQRAAMQPFANQPAIIVQLEIGQEYESLEIVSVGLRYQQKEEDLDLAPLQSP